MDRPPTRAPSMCRKRARRSPESKGSSTPSKRWARARHCEWVMQAEGEVVRIPPLAKDAPRDFRSFFEDEHRRLFQTLYVVIGRPTGGRRPYAAVLPKAL